MSEPTAETEPAPDEHEGDREDDRGSTDGQGGPGAEVSDDELSEIEEERERRLDPDNRPDSAEVDNSDTELPTVEEFARREAEERDEDEDGGSTDPSEKFREIEVSEEEQAEIEEERERRLDPDNRPENTEVDNTGDGMPEIAKDENQPDEGD